MSSDVFDEVAFQEWYKKHAKKLRLNPNPDDPKHFYDYRSAYRAGATPDPLSGHWPSKFKLSGHPNLLVDGKDTRTGKPAGLIAQGRDIQELLRMTAEGPWGAPVRALAKAGKGTKANLDLRLMNALGSFGGPEKDLTIYGNMFEDNPDYRTSEYHLGLPTPSDVGAARTVGHETAHALQDRGDDLQGGLQWYDLPGNPQFERQHPREYLADLLATNPSDRELESLISLRGEGGAGDLTQSKLRGYLDAVLGDESAEFVGPEEPWDIFYEPTVYEKLNEAYEVGARAGQKKRKR
jgi:hypothetical protein